MDDDDTQSSVILCTPSPGVVDLRKYFQEATARRGFHINRSFASPPPPRAPFFHSYGFPPDPVGPIAHENRRSTMNAFSKVCVRASTWKSLPVGRERTVYNIWLLYFILLCFYIYLLIFLVGTQRRTGKKKYY